jgi:hypothetical protein
MQNEELDNFFSSPNIITAVKLKTMINRYKILFGKPEGERPIYKSYA